MFSCLDFCFLLLLNKWPLRDLNQQDCVDSWFVWVRNPGTDQLYWIFLFTGQIKMLILVAGVSSGSQGLQVVGDFHLLMERELRNGHPILPCSSCMYQEKGRGSGNVAFSSCKGSMFFWVVLGVASFAVMCAALCSASLVSQACHWLSTEGPTAPESRSYKRQ